MQACVDDAEMGRDPSDLGRRIDRPRGSEIHHGAAGLGSVARLEGRLGRAQFISVHCRASCPTA